MILFIPLGQNSISSVQAFFVSGLHYLAGSCNSLTYGHGEENLDLDHGI